MEFRHIYTVCVLIFLQGCPVYTYLAVTHVLTTTGDIQTAGFDPLYSDIVYLVHQRAVCKVHLSTPSQYEFVAGYESSATDFGCAPTAADTTTTVLDTVYLMQAYYRPPDGSSAAIRKLLLAESGRINEHDLITHDTQKIIGGGGDGNSQHRLSSFGSTRLYLIRSMALLEDVLYVSSNDGNSEVISECSLTTEQCVQSTTYSPVNSATVVILSAYENILFFEKSGNTNCKFVLPGTEYSAPCQVTSQVIHEKDTDVLYSFLGSLAFAFAGLFPCIQTLTNSGCYSTEGHDLLVKLGATRHGLIYTTQRKLVVFEELDVCASDRTTGHFKVEPTFNQRCGKSPDWVISTYKELTSCLVSCMKSTQCIAVSYSQGICRQYQCYEPIVKLGETCYHVVDNEP